jgi:glycosyltransferase involved in cell wall biosynthesis
MTHLSIVVPLWNEGANVSLLVDMLARSWSVTGGSSVEAVLVDNGSSDDTAAVLRDLAAKHTWLKPLFLPVNQNYGGGIYEGCRASGGEFIVFIPGDLQYLEADLDKVTRHLFSLRDRGAGTNILVKGNRTVRRDAGSFQFVSTVYTRLANLILGLKVADINGLPKAFHRSLLDILPETRMKTFVFDAQLLFVAHTHNWRIEEVSVEFHARRHGVSSWSGKRLRVYGRSLMQLWQVRRQRHAAPLPLGEAAE